MYQSELITNFDRGGIDRQRGSLLLMPDAQKMQQERSGYAAPLHGLSSIIPGVDDLGASIKRIDDAIGAIPGIQENTDDIKALMPAVIGGLVLLAVAIIAKR